MLKIDISAVFEDRNCAAILAVLLEREVVTLAEIDLWTRMIAYAYFSNKEEVGFLSVPEYRKQVATAEEQNKCLAKFILLGLWKFNYETKQITVCKPSLILDRWNQKQTELRQAKRNELQESIKVKVTKTAKPSATVSDPWTAEQKELELAA